MSPPRIGSESDTANQPAGKAPQAKTQGTTPGLVILPPKVPTRRFRTAQSNIPNNKLVRERLKQIVARHVEEEKIIPPISMGE